MEAHEFSRPRMESVKKKNHEHQIAGKTQNSMLRYNLVHNCMPVPQVMKIPDAKAAFDKEWKKLEMIPAWQLEKNKCTELQKQRPLSLLRHQKSWNHNSRSTKDVLFRRDLVKDAS